MASSPRKRSLSDLRLSNSPVLKKLDDSDAYRMMVLRLDRPEEEIDRLFLQKALELGINYPETIKTTFDLSHETSTPNLDDSPSSRPSHKASTDFGADSRTSQSIHAPSDSSSESKGHRKTPSVAATSVTSAPSTTSETSDKSNYSKFKKGFKRFSSIKDRKKVLQPQSPVPSLPPRPSIDTSVRADSSAWSGNSGPPVLQYQPQSPTDTSVSIPLSGRPTGRRKPYHMAVAPPLTRLSSLPPTQTPPPPPAPSPAPLIRKPLPPPSPPPEEDEKPHEEPSPSPDAIDRSLAHPKLRRLRTSQLQEQLRFISFRASQTRQLRSQHQRLKRERSTAYKATKVRIESSHLDVLADLEQRHLMAEEDLHKTLEVERQACDTRLKHMQAYCNSHGVVEKGMPTRTVTSEDHRKLQDQYRMRSQMENLHGSRVNVLRERQGKQLERITDKQDKEIEKLAADYGRENEALDAQFEEQELQLEREFGERKERLVKRWVMAEAIDRRTLENETGQPFGPLPEIGWGDESIDYEDAEREFRRLFMEKKIFLDPNEGFMEIGGSFENGEADGLTGIQTFDRSNVI